MGSRSTHNEPPEEDQRDRVLRQAALAEFGRRLSSQLVKKGWSQAELVRRANAKAPKGMRIGPDSVSNYINGKYMASNSHLKVLAEALDVEPSDLLPASGVREAGESLPPINVQQVGDGAWLKVNQYVPWPIALKILALLKGEEE